METYDFLKATLMGLLEGATEFLPVSSTGHLILLGDSVNFNRDISAVFEISIQTGAIFALLIFYKRELNERLKVNSSNLFYLLAISFVPIGLFGFLFGEFIMRVLFFPVPVAISFIFGGVAILLVENKIKGKKDFAISDLSEVSNVDALKVGLVQALSLFPGMSRSGAAIVGGMYFGFSRSVATEFSFLLAVPVIIIAGAYSVFLDFQEILCLEKHLQN